MNGRLFDLHGSVYVDAGMHAMAAMQAPYELTNKLSWLVGSYWPI